MDIADLSLLITTRQSCSYPAITYSLTCSYFSDICCYMSVLTYLNFSACGYCCSQSTDSRLEALPWSRRKGHYWNSFPTTGPVGRGRCIFSHTPRIPLKSGGSRRGRQVYLQGETEKRHRYIPARRHGSREGEIKVPWNKPCSLWGSGSWFG